MIFIMKCYNIKVKLLDCKIGINRTFITLAAILIFSTSILFIPKVGTLFFISISETITDKLSILYISFSFFIISWIFYLIFGKYGKIKLGEQRQFSNIKWLSMLISVGVGPSIFYSAIIDWAYISPIISELHTKPHSAAVSYGFLHWGPIAWGICVALAVPIAIKQHLTRQQHNNISECILPPKLSESSTASVVDSFTMVGLLCGASTTLTIGISLISTCISELFEINSENNLKTIVLILITVSVSASVTLGLQRGIARLSTLSICFSFVMLITIILMGPSASILSNILDIIQQTISNSMQFIHNLNPFSPADITKSWTIFYWAWWILYAPFMSLFIAKVSSGRTIRQMLFAATVCSSLGCGFFYMVLGGFALELQNNLILDIVSTSKLTQPEQLITNIMELLPLPKIWFALLAFCSSILLVTTLDAISVSLANSSSQRHSATRKNKIFWTLIITIIPFTVINLNGDIALIKAIAIIASLPIMLLIFSGIISFIFKNKAIYQSINFGDNHEVR